jgi:hypothetical protein
MPPAGAAIEMSVQWLVSSSGWGFDGIVGAAKNAIAAKA